MIAGIVNIDDRVLAKPILNSQTIGLGIRIMKVRRVYRRIAASGIYPSTNRYISQRLRPDLSTQSPIGRQALFRGATSCNCTQIHNRSSGGRVQEHIVKLGIKIDCKPTANDKTALKPLWIPGKSNSGLEVLVVFVCRRKCPN